MSTRSHYLAGLFLLAGFPAASPAQAGCPVTQVGSATFAGAAVGSDTPHAVVVDGTGNVYMVGSESVGGGWMDWRIRKYSADLGTLLATTTFSGAGAVSDNAYAAVLDGSGNLVVAGSAVDQTAGYDATIRVYNPGLTAVLASTEYDGPVSGSEEAYAVVVDSGGNIIVAGVEQTAAMATNMFVRKYNPGLTTLLTSTIYDDTGGGYDAAHGLAVDSSDNIIIVGEGYSGSDQRWLMRKYNPGLTTVLGAAIYDSGASKTDVAQAVAVAPGGEIYVAGFDDPGASARWMVREYSGDFSTLIASTAYGSAGGYAHARAISLDPLGNVYVGGFENALTGAENWRIREFAPGLTMLLASTSYDGPSSGTDEIFGMVPFDSGVVVAGTHFNSTTLDWRVARYRFGCAEASLTITPPAPVEGQWVTVALSVSNSLTASIFSLTPSIGCASCPSIAAQGSVVPAGPIVMQAGGTTVFTWTWSVNGNGLLTFTATASGINAVSGLALQPAATATAATVPPAWLASVTTNQPTSSLLQPGQTCTVYMAVTNIGGAATNTLTPALAITRGAGSVILLSGPVPASLPSLAPGGVTVFAWTVSVTGEGPIMYSVTVSGSGTVVNNQFFTAQYGILGVGTGARLSPRLTASAGSGSVSDRVTAQVNVTNIGGAGANYVYPGSLSIWSAAGVLGPTGGAWDTGSITLLSVNPSGTLSTLAAGASMTFTYVYAVTGYGTITINNPYVDGRDAITGYGCGAYAPMSDKVQLTLTTLSSVLRQNLPDPGKAQIRRPVIRIAAGDSAWVLARVSGSVGAAIRFTLYGRSGFPLGDLGEVMPDQEGVSRLEFDGKLDGKPLATGMYWIVTSGGLVSRHQIMVINE